MIRPRSQTTEPTTKDTSEAGNVKSVLGGHYRLDGPHLPTKELKILRPMKAIRANCLDCGVPFQGVPAPVATFEPNSWGIYDMEGNVWEWTLDCMDPNSKPPLNGMPQLFGNCDSRELRGGSAESDAWSVRINSRASAQRSATLSDVGIRVVMQVPQE